MAYYHGTNTVIGMVDLNVNRNRTDFGKGFYLASNVETAQGWATRRTMISGGVPTQFTYTVGC